MSRWTRVAGRRLAPGAIVALLVAACLPAPATAEGREVESLYLVFVAAAAVVAAIVLGLATWSIVRYRAGRRPGLPVQTRGHTGLELTWTALPAVTIAVLFLLTLGVLSRVDSVDPSGGAGEAEAGERGVEIEVTAFRWGWGFTYPAEGITVSGLGEPGPEVVVPVGEPLTFRIGSADVVHSFYVPLFLFKRDAIPGRVSVFRLTVEESGTYGGQCAEFCGLYHSRMPFTVRAVSRAEFDAWLATQPRDDARGSPAAASPAPSR